MRVLGLAALLFLLMPAASAQLSLSAVGPTGLLMPEVGEFVIPVTASLECSTAVAYAPGQASLDVTISIGTTEPGVTVTGPSVITLDANACLQPGATHASGTQDYRVTASRSAPAGKALPLPFSATLGPPAPGQPGFTAENTSAVVVDYFGIVVTRMPAKIMAVGPGRLAVFDVEIEVKANGATSVSLEAPAYEGDFRVILPEPVVLGGDLPTKQTVTVTIATPGGWFWTNRQQAFTLPVHAESADLAGRQPATPETVDFLVHERGAGAGLFGLGVVLIVVVVGIAMAVRGRMKKQ